MTDSDLPANGVVGLWFNGAPLVSYRVTINGEAGSFVEIQETGVNSVILGHISPVPSPGDQVTLIVDDLFSGSTILNYNIVDSVQASPPSDAPLSAFVKDQAVQSEFLNSCDHPRMTFRRYENIYGLLTSEQLSTVAFVKYNQSIHQLETETVSEEGTSYEQWTLSRQEAITVPNPPPADCATIQYISYSGELSPAISVCTPCSYLELDTAGALTRREEHLEFCIRRDLRPFDMYASEPEPEPEPEGGDMAGEETGGAVTVGGDMAGEEPGGAVTVGGDMAGEEPGGAVTVGGDMAGEEPGGAVIVAGEIAGERTEEEIAGEQTAGDNLESNAGELENGETKTYESCQSTGGSKHQIFGLLLCALAWIRRKKITTCNL